jgi:hypothetical protein
MFEGVIQFFWQSVYRVRSPASTSVSQAANSIALVIPELCYLMNLHQEFPELSIKGAAELMAMPMSCDSGTQTPTHFVEKFIDINYNWNEWALRRCTLPLVTLANNFNSAR